MRKQKDSAGMVRKLETNIPVLMGDLLPFPVWGEMENVIKLMDLFQTKVYPAADKTSIAL